MAGIQIPLNNKTDNRSTEDRFVEWYVQGAEHDAGPSEKENIINLLKNDPEAMLKSIEGTLPQLAVIAKDVFKEAIPLTPKTVEKILDAFRKLYLKENTTEKNSTE
jgi:hypothetical protein